MGRDSVAHRNPDHDQYHERVAQDQRLALWRLGRTVEEEGRGHLVSARAWVRVELGLGLGLGLGFEFGLGFLRAALLRSSY